jgi:prolyl oligopeptidase
MTGTRSPWSPRSHAIVAGAAAVACLLLASAACSTSPAPPASRVQVVVDTLHGVSVPDPYRWLEDRHDSEVRAWIDRQNAWAEEVVGQTPLRARIEARLRELMDTPDVDTPRRAGSFEYFAIRRPGQELPVIYRRAALDGVDADDQGGDGGENTSRVPDGPLDPFGDYEPLLDPHGLSAENTTRFGVVTFSPDGRYLVYNERDGGADEVTIRIRDLDTGDDLPDVLPWGLYGAIFFDREGEGVYYESRSREIGPRLRYHRLGTDPANDPVVFGEGYGPTSRLNVSEIAGGRYLLLGVNHGWARSEVHLKDRERDGAIVTVVDDADARFYPRYHDGLLYMRTDLDAFRNRLVAVDPARPSRTAWREVIPEAEDEVMEDFAFIHGRLYVTYLDAQVNQRIRIFEPNGTPAGEIDVPEFHSASIRAAGPGEALLTLSSFLQPSITYRLNLETGERTVWEGPDVAFDASPFEVRQVWRTSRDGTRAPMWVVHRRDIAMDGSHPTMLSGYGGFYVARTPGFNAMVAAWLELGGVYAVATLRGGSEFGEAWHRDGMLERKQHVFDDFISAAEWLIDNGYTRPDRLGIQGGSNGGLLVAAAFVQRPELFGGVLCGFPDVDILRFPWYVANNNAPALLEYGDSRIPEQFEAIRRYSPYQNVRDGVSYPAVMFTTGDLDTRVPPEGALKMTARLQAASTSDRPVILRYHEKGGHSAGRGLSFSRRLADTAMELTFLAQALGLDPDRR